jgi:hypothetical protein
MHKPIAAANVSGFVDDCMRSEKNPERMQWFDKKKHLTSSPATRQVVESLVRVVQERQVADSLCWLHYGCGCDGMAGGFM